MEDQGQDFCPHTKNDIASCTNVSIQYADIGIPIKLKPYAVVGNVETECSGNPVISLRSGQSSACTCELTIMQTICIKIPLTYGTIADVGETIVNCKRSGNC